MSRAKILRQLKQKNPYLNKEVLIMVLNVFSQNIVNGLRERKNIEIRGFGHWYFKKLKENFNVRNPKTNELIYKPDRVKIRFKASKLLKKIINE